MTRSSHEPRGMSRPWDHSSWRRPKSRNGGRASSNEIPISDRGQACLWMAYPLASSRSTNLEAEVASTTTHHQLLSISSIRRALDFFNIIGYDSLSHPLSGCFVYPPSLPVRKGWRPSSSPAASTVHERGGSCLPAGVLPVLPSGTTDSVVCAHPSHACKCFDVFDANDRGLEG